MKRIVRIPIAVKVSPFFTAFGNMARRFDAAGADGLVLFNRFYQADIDITTMKTAAHVELSTSSELLLRLRWLAILYGRVRPSLAVTGGVATPEDGIKAILAGADAVQMVSALLRHGPTHVQTMRRGLERWMEWRTSCRPWTSPRPGEPAARRRPGGRRTGRLHPHAPELGDACTVMVERQQLPAADRGLGQSSGNACRRSRDLDRARC